MYEWINALIYNSYKTDRNWYLSVPPTRKDFTQGLFNNGDWGRSCMSQDWCIAK